MVAVNPANSTPKTPLIPITNVCDLENFLFLMKSVELLVVSRTELNIFIGKIAMYDTPNKPKAANPGA